MSWKTINKLLSLATADPQFYQELQQDPVKAADDWGFVLSEQEQAVFRQLEVKDLAEFSQRLIELLGPRKS